MNRCLANSEAENNLHDQSDQVPCERFNGRQGNLGAVGIRASTCHEDGDSGEVSGISVRKMLVYY